MRQTIKERLKLARVQAGLSQSQVAKMLDVTHSTVSEMEAGRRQLSAEELAQLSKIYDVRMMWLACADEDDVDDRRNQIASTIRTTHMSVSELSDLLDLLVTLRQDNDPKLGEG